ncbi:T-complex protein 1 subunit eta [Nowakowskiella sp. JEL0078]|nr:T-complex protein 1 subunit eta [Nowakowskiella sp. JEL0078]
MQVISDTVRTTLAREMDKLTVDLKGGIETISNDGETILRLLDIIHPAGKLLVEISSAQDAEEYQAVVDAEWQIIYDKLKKIVDTGANVPIGDLKAVGVAVQ